MKITELYVGLSYSIEKAFSSEEVESFAKFSMDVNPIHLNDDVAKKTIFKDKIVHGFLTSSLFSAIIGTKMPGNGSVYLKQDLIFLKPVYHNELIRATVVVKEINYEKSIVILETVIVNSAGNVAVKGEAVVKLID